MVVAFRLASWDTPFWVNPNRSAGRFNRAGSGPVQYWSLHPLAPWAEYCRGEGLRSRADLAQVRLRVWVAQVGDGATSLSFDDAAAYGMDPYDLVSDERGPCQDLGEQYLHDPSLLSAVVVPSAALPGTRNLVLFGPRVVSPYNVAPVDAVDVPAAVAAERARPLHTLLDLVRHRGDPHEAYEAWRNEVEFAFIEPRTPLLPYARLPLGSQTIANQSNQ